MRALVVVAVSMALLSCSEELTPIAEPCRTPPPAEDLSAVPRDLRLGEHATITEVKETSKGLRVTATTHRPVVEIYPPLARAILDAGYRIVSSDNEGFEAEIFFGDKATTGAYRLREGPCEEQVTVNLLFVEDGAGVTD